MSLSLRYLIGGLILSISPLSAAQELPSTLPDLETSAGTNDILLPVAAEMSELEYRRTTRYNKHLLRHAVRQYLEESFTSLGMSETSQKITGAVLGLAVQRGAKVNLNDDKTMYLELNDLDDSDRGIYYKFDYTW